METLIHFCIALAVASAGFIAAFCAFAAAESWRTSPRHAATLSGLGVVAFVGVGAGLSLLLPPA